jgi:uncharacterized protein YjaZ
MELMQREPSQLLQISRRNDPLSARTVEKYAHYCKEKWTAETTNESLISLSRNGTQFVENGLHIIQTVSKRFWSLRIGEKVTASKCARIMGKSNHHFRWLYITLNEKRTSTINSMFLCDQQYGQHLYQCPSELWESANGKAAWNLCWDVKIYHT